VERRDGGLVTAVQDWDHGPGAMRFRKLQTELDRALAKRERANRRIAKISAEMREARQAEVDRLGLTDVQSERLTPVILDVFDRIEVDGDCWLWTGARNNKGLPRMRDTSDRNYVERSACVLLDQMLNGSDGTGMRYPDCRSGRDCVNPAHKRIRGQGRQWAGVGAFGGSHEAVAS
jgi:hypothetical protein